MVTDNNEPTGTNRYNPNDVIGNYLLQERLGTGENCDTFKGVHQISQDLIAIKLFPKSSDIAKKMYETEKNAYKTLKGVPGILQLKDNDENDNVYFLVTEYIQDGSLRDILKKYPRGMEIEDVMHLFAPVADAIDRMHGKNIIHRDLKPENILALKTKEGYKIFIADFGVVRFTNTSQAFQTEHTTGTSWYIAPESWTLDSNSPQTKAVDIYALGIMLYEALEGKFPYDNISQVINNQTPLPPTHTIQEAGLFVAESLLKTIHNDPKQRPVSAKEVINGMRHARDGNLNIKQRWIGRKINNYKVEEVLRAGTMGITLRASDSQTNKQVVLKAFVHSVERNKKAYEKEIHSLDRLENGHGILKPHEIFEYEDTSFIVTEYQSGGTLRDLLNRKTKLPTNEIMDIFTQIAEAIDYIHEKKIVHRDIKPENVVYSIHEGKVTPFITDFGVSAILASTQSSFPTREIGTHRYMAPELWDPKARGTKAVDIYAFGIMLYEALVGHAPSESSSAKQPSALVAEKTFKELAPHAKNILLQARAKDAVERPKTATEIMQQIRGQHEMFLGKTYGKYTIESFIGRGTYGATYRAYISKGKKKFAFKVLFIQEPLMREIDTLKKLTHHSGIASILDGGRENGIHYIVTDYLNGNSLRDELQSYPLGMGLDETLKFFKSIAKAIDYLHDIGTVHGDIKPENVILCKNRIDTNSFDPVITGFGISKLAGKIQSFHSNNNYNYIAPELWQDGEPSRAADIYAFSIMLYETLEGSPPFSGKSLAAKMSQHLNDKPPIPKNLSQLLGKNAVDVIMQALDKNPERRQKSASELVSQLEDMAQSRVPDSLGPIRGPLMMVLNPILNASKKKIELSLTGLIGLIGLGIAAVLLIGFVFSLFRQPPPNTPAAVPSQSGITQPSLTESPITEEKPGATSEPAVTNVPTIISITPLPPQCNNDLRYLPIPVGWNSDYKANSFTLIKGLYPQFYGKIRDNLDLYALAYYNNRKALETGSYSMIDPEKLSIEKGAKIFLPPLSWIDEYRKFPKPILETLSQDTKYPSINISGNSTLYPLSQQIKGCFEKLEQSYDIQIEANNTKSGLIDFCQGKADVFGASEEITPMMIRNNGCLDVNFLKFEVARYATVIFINDQNPYAEELREYPLDSDELARLLFSAQLWSDVRSDWDSKPIIRYYPPVEGGTFEIVTNNISPDFANNPKIYNLNKREEGDLISQEVANDQFSIGFSSYADYQSKIGNLTPIAIDKVFPNSDTIQGDNPTYPLTRSLYLYTSKTRFNETPLLRYFINYFLVYELDFLDEFGYFHPNAKNFLNDQYYPRVK